MAELEFQTNNMETFEKLGELMFSPDDKGVDKLNEAYKKAISLGGRISQYKNLVDGIKVSVGIVRQALGIDNADGESNKPTLPQTVDPTVPPQDAYMRMIGK